MLITNLYRSYGDSNFNSKNNKIKKKKQEKITSSLGELKIKTSNRLKRGKKKGNKSRSNWLGGWGAGYAHASMKANSQAHSQAGCSESSPLFAKRREEKPEKSGIKIYVKRKCTLLQDFYMLTAVLYHFSSCFSGCHHTSRWLNHWNI